MEQPPSFADIAVPTETPCAKCTETVGISLEIRHLEVASEFLQQQLLSFRDFFF